MANRSPCRSPVRLLFVCSLLASAASATAQAQEASVPRQEIAAGDRPENGYWSVGEPRWFVSAKPEIGTPYVKPYLSVGYGLPHWIWAGIDVNAILTTGLFQAYGGVRASSPILDLAFGIRDTWSFDKHLMRPADVHREADVDDSRQPLARYWAWEFEAVAVLPLPNAALIADFIAVRTLDVPEGYDLFEESYRAIVRDPLLMTLRVLPIARILSENALRIGALGEMVFHTGRGRPVFRLGPAASLQLTDHLEANLVVTLAISSPDRLGLTLGAYGIAGLRWRWASGERNPRAPWQGHFIPW